MPLQPGPATTRRTTLGAAGLALLATGCGASDGTRDDVDDPDRGVVDEAVLLAATALASARATGRRHPSLAGRVQPLVALHRAHLAALPEPSAAAVPAEPGGRPAAALARLTDLEGDTWRRLADLAVAAESGPLARLLASMAAGIAAHLAAGTTDTGTG